MGSTPTRAATKAARSPVATRRSGSKNLKSETPPTPSPTKTGKGVTTPRTNYTHHLPSAQDRRGNGRVAGRSLIVWGRPRMAEKLLLHLQYECARHKANIPWDTVAHRLHPGSSGAAVQQYLNRLRRELIAEGHLVPPPPTRPVAEAHDPSIRGYVRADLDGEDKETVRPVKFDEPMEDRKMSLPSVDNFETNEAEYNGDDSDGEQRRVDYGSPTPSRRSFRPINAGRRLQYGQHASPSSGMHQGQMGFVPNHARHIGQEGLAQVPEELIENGVDGYTHSPAHNRYGPDGSPFNGHGHYYRYPMTADKSAVPQMFAGGDPFEVNTSIQPMEPSLMAKFPHMGPGNPLAPPPFYNGWHPGYMAHTSMQHPSMMAPLSEPIHPSLLNRQSEELAQSPNQGPVNSDIQATVETQDQEPASHEAQQQAEQGESQTQKPIDSEDENDDDDSDSDSENGEDTGCQDGPECTQPGKTVIDDLVTVSAEYTIDPSTLQKGTP